MKQGSTDDPFAEDSTEVEATGEPTADTGDADRDDAADSEQASEATAGERGSDGDETPVSRTIPYIYKRDAVKERRSQRPVYLREYNEERIPSLVDAVEAELGDDVPKTDVLEAAMEAAIENPRLVAEILRSERYGYDWD